MKLISARYRPWIVYTALSLMSLGIMTSNLQGGSVAGLIESTALRLFSPIYQTVERFFDYCRTLWSDYVYLVHLQSENRHLKETIQTLQEEHILLLDKAYSADRLESLIRASFRSPAANIPATVIRRGNTLLNPTILIDRGSSDGLREGLGVASADGALGQIVHITPGISKVLTLHHTDAGIGAMLQTSRVQGVVSGTGKGTSIMRFVSRFDPVILGESVVTSGLDGAFPKGIPIGKVSAVRRDASEMFQTVDIVTNVNMNTVEDVIVFLMPPLPDIEISHDSGTDPVALPDSAETETSSAENIP
jgi:rod shape-determining protein MreC